MNLINIIGIAIGLAMDAFAVSVIDGSLLKQFNIKLAIKIAFFFGAFQAIMPIIGWASGITFYEFLSSYSNWLAFGILLFIGLKMIYESIYQKDEQCNNKSCQHLPTLLMLSLATSLDALAVGFSFSLINVEIIYPALIIGIITFIISLVGCFLGYRFGHLFEKQAEILGGSILIIIGIKILLG